MGPAMGPAFETLLIEVVLVVFGVPLAYLIFRFWAIRKENKQSLTAQDVERGDRSGADYHENGSLSPSGQEIELQPMKPLAKKLYPSSSASMDETPAESSETEDRQSWSRPALSKEPLHLKPLPLLPTISENPTPAKPLPPLPHPYEFDESDDDDEMFKEPVKPRSALNGSKFTEIF